MKKAIHIAGFTIGVIVLYALAIAALAQNPPQKVQITNCDPVIQVTGIAGLTVRVITVEFPCPLKPGETVNFTVCAGPDGKAVACPPNARRESNPDPFDVPAVDDKPQQQGCFTQDGDYICGGWKVNPPKTCTDKSRFLLFSEDGKAHCLKLVPHD